MFFEKTIETFKRTLDVNLLGSYITARRAYNHMINAKWGRIINISSTNGMNTYYPMGIEYDTSKAALNALTHNLAIQFAPYVTVNAIAPGFIGTENELKDYDEEFMNMDIFDYTDDLEFLRDFYHLHGKRIIFRQHLL